MAVDYETFPLKAGDGTVVDYAQFRRVTFDPLKPGDKPESYLIPTWTQLEQVGMHLADQLTDADIKPDFVVAIANGALPYASTFTQSMGYEGKILTVGVTGYDLVTNEPLEDRQIVYPLPEAVDLTDKTVVIFDEINDKGKTFLTVNEHVQERGAGRIITAALLGRPDPKFYTSDFTGCVVDDTWIVYPHDRFQTKKGREAEWEKRGLSEIERYQRHSEMFPPEILIERKDIRMNGSARLLRVG